MSRPLPPCITLEEHWLCPAFTATQNFRQLYGENLKNSSGLDERIRDVSDVRIRDMDRGNVAVQVVSHGPGLITLEDCRRANDEMHQAVAQRPSRFAGFAVLPVAQPEACVTELNRCVQDLGFRGALIDNHTLDGTFFNGPAYDPMWEAFEQLDVVCYLHPTWSTASSMSNLYNRDNDVVSTAAAWSMATSGWGWHSEVGLHVLKLFASGIFDKFPKLKLIIGHFGEMLPFMLDRISLMSRRWKHTGKTFRQVWDENIWLTTSGVWSVDPMATILRNTKIDHVLFSVDYPLANTETGLKWMEDLSNSGLVDSEGLEKIAFKNAKELLRLQVDPSPDQS